MEWITTVKSFIVQAPGSKVSWQASSATKLLQDFVFLGTTTFSITTLSLMTLSIMTLSIMRVSKMTLNIMSASIKCNTHHDDTQHNILQSDIYSKCRNKALCWVSLSWMTLCWVSWRIFGIIFSLFFSISIVEGWEVRNGWQKWQVGAMKSWQNDLAPEDLAPQHSAYWHSM